MKFFKSNSRLLLALSSGLLLALAYPSFDVNLLGWLALTPLVWALLLANPKDPVDSVTKSSNASDANHAATASTLKPRKPFALGWASGFVFFLVTLYWLLVLPITPMFWAFL